MSLQTYMRTKAAFVLPYNESENDWDYEVSKSIIKAAHMTCALYSKYFEAIQ